MQQPNEPPPFALRFLHDDAKAVATSWSTGYETIDNASRMVVRAKNSQGDPVNKLEFYSDGGNWRLSRQYPDAIF
jgi:hypothetical protein